MVKKTVYAMDNYRYANYARRKTRNHAFACPVTSMYTLDPGSAAQLLFRLIEPNRRVFSNQPALGTLITMHIQSIQPIHSAGPQIPVFKALGHIIPSSANFTLCFSPVLSHTSSFSRPPASSNTPTVGVLPWPHGLFLGDPYSFVCLPSGEP